MQTDLKLKDFFCYMNPFHKCHLQTNHLDKIIFFNYNLLVDMHIGCLKLINSVSECEVKLTLT